jgi:hypothetical protein
MEVPPALRDGSAPATCSPRQPSARIIGDLQRRGSGLVELPVLLEGDDNARALLEMELLGSTRRG